MIQLSLQKCLESLGTILILYIYYAKNALIRFYPTPLPSPKIHQSQP